MRPRLTDMTYYQKQFMLIVFGGLIIWTVFVILFGKWN